MTVSAGPGFSLIENAADCDALLHGWQPAENPLCALQREAALCLPAKLPIKWHLQSRSEGKRGAEISLISRLVRCVSLWALLIMSNQSKVPTWKNWLLQKRKRKKNNWALCVLLSPALTAADGREGPHLWGSPASVTFPLGWILIPFFRLGPP